MKKLKDILKNNIIKEKNLPIIIFIILLIIIHFSIDSQSQDDLWFINQASNFGELTDYISARYSTWSSRLIIESGIIMLTHQSLLVWKILNILMYILLAKSIIKITNIKNNKWANYLLYGLVLLIPLNTINGAGWISTTMNYLWVISLGLFSLSSIKDVLEEKKIPIWKNILYIISGIYACNQEQMAVAYLLTIFTVLLWQLIIKKNKNILKHGKILIIELIISIVSIIFIITCPGNKVRMTQETANWFPEFGSFNIVEKAELGLTSTFSKLVLNINYIFIIFSILLFITTIITNKNKMTRIISFIPLLGSTIFTVFEEYTTLFTKILDLVKTFKNETLIMKLSEINITSIIFMLLYIIIAVSALFSMYKIYKNSKKFYMCVSIFLLGFMTRIMMGFSPTVFASRERTFIFLYIALIIDSILFYKECSETIKLKEIK